MPRKRKSNQWTKKPKKSKIVETADNSTNIPTPTQKVVIPTSETERHVNGNGSRRPSKIAKIAGNSTTIPTPTQKVVIPTSVTEKRDSDNGKRRQSIDAGIPYQTTVVRGSRSQNSIRFSLSSRNRQCTAISAVALAYDELIPFSAWNTTVIDNILDYGDQLYKKSISSRPFQNSNDPNELLFVIEVYRNFMIDNVTYTLNINEIETVTGHLGEVVENRGELDVSLANGLSQVFQNYRSAIFTCGLMSVCVNKTNTAYYLFDSHSRGKDGKAIEQDGKACLIKFPNSRSLAVFILQNFDRDHLYTLVPIRVSIGQAVNLTDAGLYHILKVYDATTSGAPSSRTSRRIPTKPIRTLGTTSNKVIGERDGDCGAQTSTTVVREAADEHPEVSLHDLGPMDSECTNCKALFFRNENQTCCRKGAVSIPASSGYPQLLKALLTENTSRSRGFMRNVRRYNTLLALGSTTFAQREGLGRGAPVIVVSGQIYHRVGDIDPSDPSFGSLYFVDSGEATRKRTSNTVRDGCDPIVLGQIDALLRDTHPFARMYRTLGQVVQDARRTGGDDSVSKLGLFFHHQPGTDRKTHAAPSNSNEIGAIFRTVDGDIPPPGTIRVHLINSDANDRTFQIRDIPRLSPIVDALCYPLIFPHGELGWSTDLPSAVGDKRIGKRDFEIYRLMSRADIFNPILLYGRLTQQFIVDKYVELEGDRLNYLRTHQAQLRAETYAGIQDYIARRVEEEPVGSGRIGRAVILPSSFTGGPRYMQQNYQDAMAIVAKYGRPSLFVTFTCNPNWHEIKDNMGSIHLNPQDRPELIARVFELKRRAFFEDVLKSQIFGEVIAFVYVIEFQKRGLPHMHCLITLSDKDKLRQPDDVDKIICAELPAPGSRLFNIIMSTMIHGPCGDQNPNSPCMIDGQCSKHYPKTFSDTTAINQAWPVYRRRNDGRTASFDRGTISCTVDNRDVVPYSPYLSMKYESHINVEVVTSVGSVKYVFKYINKGPDAAVIQVRDEIILDEIKAFIDSRYVSSGESAWRLLAFPIQDKSHTIYRLPVHLPGESVVYFDEGQFESALQHSKLSLLEAYFELNASNPRARHLKYCEVPLYYWFIPSQHRWAERQRNRSVIPRMYTISPKYIEKFHLRVLLLHVAGPTSFEDLRTFSGVTYPTFREAVRARGLVASDLEWVKTMEHAALVEMPGCMRKLFAYILCFCEVADPVSLWSGFKRYMVEDYRRKGFSERDSEDRALRRIERVLRFLGKTLKDFGLPDPSSDLGVDDVDDDEAPRPDSADFRPEDLNPEQRSAFDRIVAAIDSTAVDFPRLFYLQGSGGTGKTHLYNTLLSYCEGRNLPSIAVAFTGIAALLLRNGRTVHSTFRLPLDLMSDSRSSISAQSQEADRLRNLRLIIWDEVSMASHHVLSVVDALLRDVCMDQRPFGGKCILLGGDVKQLLPVGSGRVQQVELFFANYRYWTSFEVIRLTTNMRVAAGEQEFTEWLEDLGRGNTNVKITVDGDENSEFVCLPKRCLTDNVVREIYAQLDSLTPEQLAGRAILCPRNDHCNLLNDRILEAFPGALTVVTSLDSVASGDEDEVANFPEEYLNTITPSGMPHHELRLKVGVPVILLRNLSLEDGLINGTRLLVLAVSDVLLTAQIVTGRFVGRTVLIPRMDLTSADKTLPFVLKRRQFPVKVCFALTINKAQGQTFERVGIYLASPVFSHGQLYVAFSRARSWDAVKVEVVRSRYQGYLLHSSNEVFTKNIVYDTILKFVNEKDKN